MRSYALSFIVLVSVIGVLPVNPADAAINPFTEHFANDHANWYNPAGTAPVDWMSSGGPDGSSYVTTNFNFVAQTPGLPIPNNAVVLFRAQDEFNSSNHAFEGNWIADGVAEFSFWVRHNAPSPMNVFARFATPMNFPAWSGIEFTPVAPNTWTNITIEIDFSNPNLFYEGPPPTMTQFTQVFGNIGHVQIGAFGGTMAGVDHLVTFDLDMPSIIPAPGAMCLLAALALAARRRRSGPA